MIFNSLKEYSEDPFVFSWTQTWNMLKTSTQLHRKVNRDFLVYTKKCLRNQIQIDSEFKHTNTLKFWKITLFTEQNPKCSTKLFPKKTEKQDKKKAKNHYYKKQRAQTSK